ncbi:MAG: hypothetical protein JSR26_08445 [Proteobacteria bacterium]|nr:hypothetical protein [Pseudomonadota bacterium]
MNAAPLIRELNAAGIRLSATGDRLHVEAPAGAVTPEIRHRLAANKAGILTYLHQPATVADLTDRNRMRAALLALADGLHLDRALVHRLTSVDLADCAGFPADALRGYLLALDDSATRHAGKVPEGETAPIYCQHCGPVWTHPDVAAVLPVVDGWPRALGCRWCFIRKAGGYIPRPLVTCDTCASFQPDTVNPGAGMGTCACGMHYPMQPHRCEQYQPKDTSHD